MSGNEDIPIVMIEPNGGVYKQADRDWRTPVVYVLEDGRRLESAQRFSLKRDAVKLAATLPTQPTRPMKGIFQDGRFVGTSTLYGLVAGGL